MIMVDDDGGCMMGTLLPPPPGFVPPTIQELLNEGFPSDETVCFYLCEGRPMLVWPDLDYATDWSKHPIREIHPFYPIKYGREIMESEFRALVKTIHRIG